MNSNIGSLPKVKLIKSTLRPPSEDILVIPKEIESPRRKVINYHRRHLAAARGHNGSSFVVSKDEEDDEGIQYDRRSLPGGNA